MRIIINADDFGLNQRCTDAICEAFDRKYISDTSLMANGEACDYAVRMAARYGLKSMVGIHFNLTEGTPLTERIKRCPSFVSNGVFHSKVNRYKRLTEEEKKAVYEELSAQIEKIQKSGMKITHADSHHHIHTAIFVAPIVLRACKDNGIKKIRLHRNIGSISTIKRAEKYAYNKWLHMNSFITTAWFGSMQDVLSIGLKDKMEIMVHPDYGNGNQLIDRTSSEDNTTALGKSLILPTSRKDIKLIRYEDL